MNRPQKVLVRVFLSLAFLAAHCFHASAHIGSPGVFFEGVAGPYPLRVVIRPPEVVPGLARITIRVHQGNPTSVGALPVRWDAGRKGAPPPDIATLIPGETNLYETELWLMDSGAYSVFVEVDGDLGPGTAIVPLNSLSSQRLPMPRWMGVIFLTAGAILFLLLVMLVGAGVRESVLPPGESVPRKRRFRAIIFQVLATLFFASVLWQGKRWWDEVDAEFRHNRLFTPVEMASQLRFPQREPRLHLSFDRGYPHWRDFTPIVPDHGKRMHLFLVRNDHDVFAHLHPEQLGENQFQAALPNLPAGDYSIYGDITQESGLTQTLISKINLSNGHAAHPSALDPDDSWWSAPEAKSGATPQLHWLNPVSPIAGRDLALKFELRAADGQPAPIEPYMGMWSHAVIRSHDGSVFTHLHPLGTISMAAQELFAQRERAAAAGVPLDVICGRPGRELSFPYAFPKPGPYRIWVQVKSLGRIITQPFDLTVQ